MGFSFESMFEVDYEIVRRLIIALFNAKGQQDVLQRLFNEAAVKDALSYFNSTCERGANISERTWNILESIAVSMYLRGFNRAFEYYIKHEDIFNLEDNEDTK